MGPKLRFLLGGRSSNITQYSNYITDIELAGNSHGPCKRVWLVLQEWGDVCMWLQRTDYIPIQFSTRLVHASSAIWEGVLLLVIMVQLTEQEAALYVFIRNIKIWSFDLNWCKAYTNGRPVCVCPLGCTVNTQHWKIFIFVCV